jgi:methyl-accepting chemotaxis protein
MGLLDNNQNFEDRIANVVVKVFNKYGIEPGEMNKKMNDTIELVQELAPVVRGMEDLSQDLDNDVDALREDVNRLNKNIEKFNSNAGSLADQLEETAESFEDFAKLAEDAARQKKKNEEENK